MLTQVVQVAGSLLILAAFVAAQTGRMPTGSVRYLALNVVGSGVLAVLAAMHREYGFLLLEGVWACVSAVGLVAALRGRPTSLAAAHGSGPATFDPPVPAPEDIGPTDRR